MTRAHRPSREHGSVSFPLAIVFPAVFLFMMLIVQFALWAHARNIVIAATQDAALDAASGGGADVRELLDDYGGERIDVVGTATASVADSGGGLGRVYVQVEARVPTIFDMFDLPIRAEASAPVEGFYP